jgi:MOSC domain-containing protein YiiM
VIGLMRSVAATGTVRVGQTIESAESGRTAESAPVHLRRAWKDRNDDRAGEEHHGERIIP